MKFREIEVFWAVYKAQSVKEAARALNVSQPAISMMLKSAEERSGLKLFERVGGRLKPTADSRALFAAAASIFTEIKEFDRQLIRVKEGREEFIRIAGTPTLLSVFVEPALADFRMRHPGVCVIVRTATTEQTVAWAADGSIDFGIAYGPADHPETGTQTSLATEVAGVFRSDHPLGQQAEIGPEHLEGESVLSYRSDTPLGRKIERLMIDQNIQIDFALRATAFTAAHVVSRGNGIALIDPVITRLGLFRDLTSRPFRPTIEALIQIVTPGQNTPSLICQNLLRRIGVLMKAHAPVQAS